MTINNFNVDYVVPFISDISVLINDPLVTCITHELLQCK